MALTESEARDLRLILENIFGMSEVSGWEMNEKVLGVTAEMFHLATACSAAVNFVPRPGIVDKDYFRRQLRDMARRVALGGRDIYNICSKTGVRSKWRMALAIASQGA